jgi:hypothetical protein
VHSLRVGGNAEHFQQALAQLGGAPGGELIDLRDKRARERERERERERGRDRERERERER